MSTRLPTQEGKEPATHNDLVEYFHAAGKPRERWRVGAEFERFLVHAQTGRPLGYEGAGGIWEIFSRLAGRFGWVPFINEARHITALRRGQTTLSMEPGGQFELSTAPAERLSEIDAELDRHRDELATILDFSTVGILASGIHPTSKAEAIPLMPRVRHRVMAEYLPQRSPTALDMMKATCSTQAAFDYANEADAALKMTVALKLSPIVNALWGNGPVYGGEDTGLVSYRGKVWSLMDPDRSGMLEPLLESGFSFQAWTDFLLDMPMMLTYINGRYQPAFGRPFRDFLERGENGYFPTLDDWEVHITTAFPEARLKKFVEVRGADACPRPLAVTVPAFWKGLLYDDRALQQAGEIAAQVPITDLPELHVLAYREGLSAMYRRRRLLDWCRDLLDLAAAGLGSERSYLDPLFAVQAEGKSPGMAFRARQMERDPLSLIRAFAFEPLALSRRAAPPVADATDTVF